ncbi:peptidase S8 [Chromobacterium amazonense]|uniref:S8 family serine peptidase n=1 Tax=Chromobacterium amazonense TaxID=1382803 RepID=UPI0008D9111C|nr:S8 family serine peptidase [Chromobacterium amazonense]OHX11919.1 peptidase S8 [Chromobacterium amazonense]
MQLRFISSAIALALASQAGHAAAPGQPAYPLQAGDPLANQQWHLQNTGQNAFSKRGGAKGIDLDLAFTHLRGIRGVGTTIAVIDDGLEIRHPDLAANIVPGSKNLVTGSDDPTPASPDNAHGTSVAGIAAAVGYNGIGGRGVAPSAGLKGFNWLLSQTMEGWLLSHGKQPGGKPLEAFTDARVFNQSYGSSAITSQPGNPDADIELKTEEETYEEVSRNSHWGRGAVFVKSAGNAYNYFRVSGGYLLGYQGNNGLPVQDSNLTTDNSNYWNVVVSALNADGVRSSYSSVGANVLLTAPGGEYGTDSPAMVTTDLSGCNRGYNVSGEAANSLHGGTALDPNCDYNSVMNGTSSAAPATSGSFALVMSANPALSARDVRHLLITTARKVDAAQPGVTLAFKDSAGNAHSYQALPGWQKNAAGLSFHPFYGFGLIDVDKAVEKALFYQRPLPPLEKTRWQTVNAQAAIPDGDEKGVESVFNQPDNLTVEAVQILVDAQHGRASDLAVELISPSGTRSVLLSPRTALVAEEYGLNQQRLLSNHFYGEPAKGQWRLRVIDSNGGEYQFVHRVNGKNTTYSLPNAAGKLKSWSIRFFGHRSAT